MKRCALVLTIVATLATDAAAESDWPAGDEVARRINARDEGVAVSRSLEMELIDKRGGSRIRKTRSFRKNYGEVKKTAIFYLEPKNIKDTAFLTFDYADPERDDDQWLYLPAVRRVRRISASDRGSYFLGTDLTYDDVKRETKVTLEDYRWKTLGEDRVGGHHCFVVEAIPVDDRTSRELGYSKVVSCVDSEIWMVRVADYWDIRGAHLKTVAVTDIQQVQGIWTQLRVEVDNHRRGHRSVFVFSDVDYESGLDDDLFTEQMLRRGLR